MSSPITNALSNAKKVLAKANQTFPSPTAKAPYSLARQARKEPGVDYNPLHTVKAVVDVFKHPEGGNLAAGLKSASDNVNSYLKSAKQ